MTPVSEPAWTHVVTGGPWYKRRGLRCRVLTPFDTPRCPPGGRPWTDLGEREVVILIEEDPLDEPAEFGHDSQVEGWSCIISRDDVAPIDPRP